jgi:cell division transport system permease protein
MGGVLNAPFPRRGRFVNVIRNTYRYLFLGAARGWVRNLGSTGPALGSMTLLLVLSGLVGMTSYSLERLAATQASDVAVLHVYLRDDARQQDVDALRAKLSADRRVARVTYVSKNGALQRAQRRPGLPDLAGAAEDNPFPASLDLQLRNVGDVGALAGSVDGNPAVDPIVPTSYNPGAYQRIQRTLVIVAVAGALFLLLFGFVAVAVTANSIRAAIFARQHEVVIMQLVGAPRWMVRGPFLLEGAMTGGIAGFVAGAVTLVVSLVAIAAGASTFSQIAPGVTVQVCLVAATIIFLAGLALGSAASLVSVHQQLESSAAG